MSGTREPWVIRAQRIGDGARCCGDINQLMVRWGHILLVGGWPTPLKNMTEVNWDDYILNIWKVIKAMCQTTNQIIYDCIYIYNHITLAYDIHTISCHFTLWDMECRMCSSLFGCLCDSIDQPWLQGFPWPKGGAGSVDRAALKTIRQGSHKEERRSIHRYWWYTVHSHWLLVSSIL